jgi:hypothetical protein
MKLYLAGPLFTEGERWFVEQLAQRLEADGFECFVPHRQTFDSYDYATIYAVDGAALRDADAVVAWLDGPIVDDGTACEIGIFAELCRTQPERYRGIVGLSADWRAGRARDAGAAGGGVNFFVGGAITSCGSIVHTVDDVHSMLTQWRTSSK